MSKGKLYELNNGILFINFSNKQSPVRVRGSTAGNNIRPNDIERY
jgi:hypothetical protein